jgi:hypothetical protein
VASGHRPKTPPRPVFIRESGFHLAPKTGPNSDCNLLKILHPNQTDAKTGRVIIFFKKTLVPGGLFAYLQPCPISHVPVVVCRLAGFGQEAD